MQSEPVPSPPLSRTRASKFGIKRADQRARVIYDFRGQMCVPYRKSYSRPAAGC